MCCYVCYGQLLWSVFSFWSSLQLCTCVRDEGFTEESPDMLITHKQNLERRLCKMAGYRIPHRLFEAFFSSPQSLLVFSSALVPTKWESLEPVRFSIVSARRRGASNPRPQGFPLKMGEKPWGRGWRSEERRLSPPLVSRLSLFARNAAFDSLGS